MKAFITKASSDYWYRIKEFTSLDALLTYQYKVDSPIILEKNELLHDEDIWTFWNGMTKADAWTIANECKYHITIYDDYLE